MTQFQARYVNGTLLSKVTINASISDVARGHFARQYSYSCKLPTEISNADFANYSHNKNA